jgi:hypothetical protein
MLSKAFPDVSSIEPLPDLVSELQKHVNEVRRAGNPAAIIAAANAAADAIEQRVVVCSNDAERAALTAVKRFTYNAAADCWPGWSVTGPAVDASSLLAALQLTQRSAALVESLALGSVQEGTAIWLSGAFELALRRLTEASSSFARASVLHRGRCAWSCAVDGRISDHRPAARYKCEPGRCREFRADLREDRSRRL